MTSTNIAAMTHRAACVMVSRTLRGKRSARDPATPARTSAGAVRIAVLVPSDSPRSVISYTSHSSAIICDETEMALSNCTAA